MPEHIGMMVIGGIAGAISWYLVTCLLDGASTAVCIASKKAGITIGTEKSRCMHGM